MTEQPSTPAAPASSASSRNTPAPVRQRSTPQKAAVNRVLDELPDFLSAQDLFQLLRERGEKVSLATVYRTLQQQVEDGTVDMLTPDDGEARYRRCAVEEHHHHLVCRQCGSTVEILAPTVESWAAQTAAEHGYTSVEHTVEIYGLCPACSAESAASPDSAASDHA
ncbi:Fur family transcriptional regulator [Micrococcus sp. IITD107]|uniref:Fur family transcriptional regulator n=1 Tax=Micrococcus sp. IITD107 TaxID=3342790 RepID=UPI0035BB3F05